MCLSIIHFFVDWTSGKQGKKKKQENAQFQLLDLNNCPKKTKKFLQKAVDKLLTQGFFWGVLILDGKNKEFE